MKNKVFLSIVGTFMMVSVMGFSDALYADNGKRLSNLNLDSRVELGGDTDEKKIDARAWANWSYDPALMGTVTAVNGETITVKSGKTGSTYTVDASSAKIKQGDNTVALSTIAVGDSVLVQGAINGSSVVATSVIEIKSGSEIKTDIKGDLSGVVGKVTAVNGSTITISAKNNITYTINAANAKFWKNKNNPAVLADIAVGDTIIVQGKVNGTTVAATNVIDVNLPVNKENKNMITGQVTAVSGSTITLKDSKGVTYTALAADAEFKNNKEKDQDINDIKVGETISVKGELNGNTITADTVIEGKIRGNGFFHKFGSFVKNLFSKNR